jgi:Cu+-exporting ATPase
VIVGSSAVDTSMMTGEPVPRDVGEGDTVLGGTISTSGALIAEALTVGAHTQLAQMAVLAEQAQARKASIQTLSTVVAVACAVGAGVSRSRSRAG